MINICFDRELLQSGIKVPVNWEYSRMPHVLLTGNTGSGKSYALRIILGRIATQIPKSRLIVCDFKGEDLAFLQGSENYFRFMECRDGLDKFYQIFTDRLNGIDQSRTFYGLVFDEWAAFIQMLDKKTAEDCKQKLSAILMMGRSIRTICLICLQRPDAQLFNTARDNFNNVIALGNLSKEAVAMLGFDKDKLLPAIRQGEGHMLFNGINQTAIAFPRVRNQKALEDNIKRLL